MPVQARGHAPKNSLVVPQHGEVLRTIFLQRQRIQVCLSLTVALEIPSQVQILQFLFVTVPIHSRAATHKHCAVE